MVELLTHEQIYLFKEMFSLYDIDGDGELSSKELGTVMHLLCKIPKETDLQPVMNVIDHNNYLTITFAQFLNVVARIVKGEVSEKKLKEAFRVLDKDKKGFITTMDLRQSLTCVDLTQEEVNEMLQNSDIKENMEVNYDAFAKMMTGK